MNGENGYFGKYRGIVVKNTDPMQIGMIQIMVPNVSHIALTNWAIPCVPVAGMHMGMFTVPLIGAGLRVEFEQGDPDYPIWVGCYWGTASEVPVLSHMAPPAVPGAFPINAN